jgi:hypothetical protein
MSSPRISESFIRHVLRRHKDWTEMLKLESDSEIEDYVRGILESPDEIYRDRFRVSVEYYSKKISEHYLCIVVA